MYDTITGCYVGPGESYQKMEVPPGLESGEKQTFVTSSIIDEAVLGQSLPALTGHGLFRTQLTGLYDDHSSAEFADSLRRLWTACSCEYPLGPRRRQVVRETSPWRVANPGTGKAHRCRRAE